MALGGCGNMNIPALIISIIILIIVVILIIMVVYNYNNNNNNQSCTRQDVSVQNPAVAAALAYKYRNKPQGVMAQNGGNTRTNNFKNKDKFSSLLQPEPCNAATQLCL